jgi:hypothetical protein
LAVLCDAISVVVRRDSVKKYFSGGWQSFLEIIPNGTFCSDDELARVGFLNPNNVKIYVENLVEHGLQFQSKRKSFSIFKSSRDFDDIVVIDQYQGPTLPCPWVEFGSFEVGDTGISVPVCWLFEGNRIMDGLHLKTLNMQLSAPEGWKPEDTASMRFVE